jgi:hypothetical protein
LSDDGKSDLSVSRIGPTPGLSLLPQNSTNLGGNRVDPIRGRPADAVAATLPVNRAQLDSGYAAPQSAPSSFNTAAPSPTSNAADEFGHVKRTASQASGNTSQNIATGSVPTTTPAPTTRRTTSTGGTTSFKVANPQDGSNGPRRNPSTNGAAATNNANSPSWLNAEDEKVQLYEKARARAERIQGVMVSNVRLFFSAYSSIG